MLYFLMILTFAGVLSVLKKIKQYFKNLKSNDKPVSILPNIKNIWINIWIYICVCVCVCVCMCVYIFNLYIYMCTYIYVFSIWQYAHWSVIAHWWIIFTNFIQNVNLVSERVLVGSNIYLLLMNFKKKA